MIEEKHDLVICVGAAKAGTTSLYALMAGHPAVNVTRAKETDFFFDPKLYTRGCTHYWNTYFEHSSPNRLYFEADPIYMYAHGCMQRIYECSPTARIIVMLRNPVDRAYSQYLYRMAYARYRESFAAMCEHEAERVRVSEADRLEYGCLDRSRYAPQVREILSVFPRDRVYFLLFEEFIAAQAVEFNKLLLWLGLSEIAIEPARENAGAAARSMQLARLLYHPGYRRLRGKLGALLPRGIRQRTYQWIASVNAREPRPEERPQLSPVLRRQLLEQMHPDIEEVERLADLDLSLWLKRA